MNMLRGVTIAIMLIGAMLVAVWPSAAAQKTAMDMTSKLESDASSKSTGSSSKDGRTKQKRRSSGKGIVEERTDGKSHNKSQESSETLGTTLKFGAGGGGGSGPTGK